MVDRRARNLADGSKEETQQTKQLEVFQAHTAGCSVQVIRSQTSTTSSWHNSSVSHYNTYTATRPPPCSALWPHGVRLVVYWPYCSWRHIIFSSVFLCEIYCFFFLTGWFECIPMAVFDIRQKRQPIWSITCTLLKKNMYLFIKCSRKYFIKKKKCTNGIYYFLPFLIRKSKIIILLAHNFHSWNI